MKIQTKIPKSKQKKYRNFCLDFPFSRARGWISHLAEQEAHLAEQEAEKSEQIGLSD
jgi:hypothetical protein